MKKVLTNWEKIIITALIIAGIILFLQYLEGKLLYIETAKDPDPEGIVEINFCKDIIGGKPHDITSEFSAGEIIYCHAKWRNLKKGEYKCAIEWIDSNNQILHNNIVKIMADARGNAYCYFWLKVDEKAVSAKGNALKVRLFLNGTLKAQDYLTIRN